MKDALWLFVIIGLMYTKVLSQHFSEFSSTEIIDDICEEVSMVSRSVSEILDCGRLCGKDSNCRRFLFCSDDSTCRLYQDGTTCVRSGDSTTCSCYTKNIGWDGLTAICPVGYYGNTCKDIVRDCDEASTMNIFENVTKPTILTHIKPVHDEKPFEVTCYRENSKVGTDILLRNSGCSEVSFNRSIAEYEKGFGNVIKNYWLGFDKVKSILNGDPPQTYSLQLQLYNSTWISCSIMYKKFQITDKTSGYTFNTTGVTPSLLHSYCGDSLSGNFSLVRNPFSTYDEDHTGQNACAVKFGGGWWFADHPDCTRSFLTGSFDGSTRSNFWLDDKENDTINGVVLTLWKD